ncbi:hypothetical protein CEE60_09395 [Stenotrophomonas maltophilia]|jgi:hypothetical protein|uniref:Lipoprotein n=2 Tax=Stenotrophomonas TaxID=40323 RepID=A0A246HMG2_STEMA|nr:MULTISPECIES: hypothetical protein [Stenotrophomonas]AOX62139.1 hypothetical protein BIZ42_07915 [Stenotrophomonas sp. LM091]MBW8374719.1 hypothetical protein [Stenotrophomonas sp.]MCX2918826.1 hypothetical protein [Stenotrophomonas rhizophila]OWQ53879.1 hypothetical protein CEE60_09395 [Stenotrophomonas maltophilia]WIA61459.1 hypothetical protein POS15_19365 [Stenotrophomonas sp. BIO128-Bstrain]
MKKSSISTAVLAALLATVALAGCKKKEDTADNNAQPAATAPAAPAPMTEAAPQPMTAATGVTVSTVTVGKTAAADKTVTSAALFAPKDDIIVSIRTDGSANNANVAAKLTFQNGQVAGEQNQVVNTTGAETTNISFKNANGWPAGKYRAEVTVDGKAAGSPQEFEVK